MSDQPEALRLAELLEFGVMLGDDREQAAAELRRLHNENQAAHAVGIQQEREMMVLEAEVERLRAALEKLARLGNEPHYGNSDGNMIARNALKE